MATEDEQLDNTPIERGCTVMFTTDSNWLLFGKVTGTRGVTPKSKIDVEITTYGLNPSKSVIKREDAVVVIKSK